LGYSPTYGSTSLCNDPLFGSFFSTTVAGGGGPSACATGAPSTPGVVGGTCQGWPKPSWQSLLGNPSDGVRDTPDVSLFAADGLWSHFYIFCWSDTRNGGAACTGDPSGWSGAGGTSFASPIMAGVQALINQKAGGPQGNPNPVYYQLAATEFGPSGSTACDSSNGNTVGNSCIFYDVTLGDMDVDCTGPNCYFADGSVGVLSTSNSTFSPAYGTNIGWDFATGIGTVNAANLVNNWPASAQNPSFSLSASPAGASVVQGNSATSTVAVAPQNGFTGSVMFTASGLPAGVTASFNPNPAPTTTQLSLAASSGAASGTFSVTVTGTSGSLSNSTTVSLTVIPSANFSLSASPSSLSIVQGTGATSAITVNPVNGFSANVNLTASGLPGGVTASFIPNPTAATSTLTLSAGASAATGTFTVTLTGTSGSLVHTTQISLAVTPAPSFSLSASPSKLTIRRSNTGHTTIAIAPSSGFAGAVSLSVSGLPNGATAAFSPNPASSSSTLTIAVSRTASRGTFNLTITGVSGNLTPTTTLVLNIRN